MTLSEAKKAYIATIKWATDLENDLHISQIMIRLNEAHRQYQELRGIE